MPDFSGRIGEIVRAFEREATPSGRRYVIRKVLAAERDDGWKTGYSDGQEDMSADMLDEARRRISAESDRDEAQAEVQRLRVVAGEGCSGD